MHRRLHDHPLPASDDPKVVVQCYGICLDHRGRQREWFRPRRRGMRSCEIVLVLTPTRLPFVPGSDSPCGRARDVRTPYRASPADRNACLAATALRRASGIEGRRSGRYPDVVPETRGERIIFAIGALAIAALVALIVLETAADRFNTRDTSAVVGQMTVAATTEAAASPSSAISTTPETMTARRNDGRDCGRGPDSDRKPDVERDRRHVGRDSLWVGGRGRDLLRDPSAGHREALPQHAFVGIIRCRCEPHSALEREAAAPAAWHLQRSGRRTRAEATSRLARPCSGGKPRSRQLNNPAGGASCCPKQP